MNTVHKHAALHNVFKAAIAALGLLATSQAMGGQKDVCKEDFTRLCVGQSWNTKNMLACFKRHPGELRPACATYTSRVRGGITRFDTLADSCQKDYANLCGTNVFKVNRAKSCLKDNRAKVSAPCGSSYDSYFAFLKTGNPSYIPEGNYDDQVDPLTGGREMASRRATSGKSFASLTGGTEQGKLLKKGKDRKGDLQRNALSRMVDNVSDKASGLLGMKKDDKANEQTRE